MPITQLHSQRIQDAPQSSSMARQAIMNGNFDVWQRGTSFTPSATGAFTADRWQITYNTDGGTLPTDTLSRVSSLTLPKSYYAFNLNVDGAGSSFGADAFYQLSQKIEHGTQLLTNGQDVTLSFYAKSDISGKKLGVYLAQEYGTGGSPSAVEYLYGDNWTLTPGWTKYSFTFTTNTLSGKTFGTDENDNLKVHFLPMWSTNNDVFVGASGAEDFVGSGNIVITQVQLCMGSEALPFEPKSYGQELKDCWRYCFVPETSVAASVIGVGFGLDSTTASIVPTIPISFRVEPTITATAGDWELRNSVGAGSTHAITNISQSGTSTRDFLGWTINSTGLTAERPYFMRSDGTANRVIIFDAEL